MDTMAFLKAFHPEGYWVLTAIAPDSGQIETRTFGPETEGAAREWIDRYNGVRNLYYSVNVPRSDLVDKKARREDIVSVPWLHVDVDARAGEPLDKELARIKTLLTEKCPVPPTFVVFSGGGYQAFWQLCEPIPINGDLARAEDAARFNKQLEVMLDGDSCHDISRIMRLPGTMNLPDAKKIARGRMPIMAEVVLYEPERVYTIEQFTQAPTAKTDLLATDVARLASIDELDKWSVPDHVKVIIAQGHDPDTPKEGDNSRSAWLFDVCCQLARAGVLDEIILGIITDPTLGISASVLDKKNPDAYARRQIARAREEKEEPLLAEMNARFFIVGNYGGKCVVAEEYHERNDEYASYGIQGREHFVARFAHRSVTVAKRLVPLGRWWLNNPNARRYDRIIFAPGKRLDEDTYNLWRGFTVQPREGDCSLFLDHVRANVGGEYSEWLLNWMARAVQLPGEQAEVAVVLRGARGVGKSFFARQFGSLFGPHFLSISDARHFLGHFNLHLEDCVVLLADESFYAGARRHASVLKSLITEPTLAIERKGYDLRQTGNHLHIVMCSNDAWVVPAGLDERRFLMLDVAPTKQRDHEYFGRVADQMNNGGREALLHTLLNRDLDGWDFRRAPDTRSLTDQKLLSLSPVRRAVYDMLATGSHPRSLVEKKCVFVVTEECPREVGVTSNALGRELRLIANRQVRELVEGVRRRGFWLLPLPEARAKWTEAHHLDWVRWSDEVKEWDATDEEEVEDNPF